ncbi:hypothetical protein G6F46_002151 [Rhizopus delemar]|nr:hypothetical protein G6F55_004710 [Rhizopus delemar]KAG1550782.1 hypothetical protein G6F51_002253 [Rhizopus arrhizus]KAG1497908.1 hypothetical protein G6F54_005442 [Rhizopus delemar]KAG1516937.1 hypothetical protein G6F53_001767 [Rhizopus delemar]KAG1560643.1 hypothetical protein G6F49_002510 [Rhizopus delemar]
MPVGKPSIQPRATKASMLRAQKQPASPPPVKETKPKTASISKATNSARPSEGVKAFMAQQRARVTATKQVTGQHEESTPQKSNKVMTGAQRYGGGSAVKESAAAVSPRKIQIVIKQAKASGKLNISSRELTKIPEEVYHVDPNSIVVDFNSSGDAWYDAEELSKFIAGDNQITEIDERLGKEFGSLKQIDFRVNKLKSLPDSIQLLQNLTSVLLPHNEFETIPSVLFQLENLKELDMSHNRLKQVTISDANIEQLDLSHNVIEEMQISNASAVKSLVKLDLSHNKIKTLPDIILHAGKIKELQVSQNQLDILFRGDVTLPSLVRLDASDNQLTRITTGSSDFPKLIEVALRNNRMTEAGMKGLGGAPNIQTLDISSNKLKDIPLTAIIHLIHLQRLDVRANDIQQIPYELGQLEELKAIHCEGNPMRITTSMDHFIESLRAKYKSQKEQAANEEQDNTAIRSENASKEDEKEEENDNIQIKEQQVDVVKRFDMSNKQLMELSEEQLNFTGEAIPGTILLSRNMFTQLPMALSELAKFIVHLDLEHNRIEEFNLTIDGLVFSSLKVLKLSNNRMKQLKAIGESTSFPKLEELVLNQNMLTSLPHNLASILPELKILSVSSNKVDNITIGMFGKKLEILNLSNNDIGQLPPELSLIEGLKELVVFGNRFRIPRPAIVDQGTQAILEFLRHRVRN